jgi:hypothetical protein
MVQNRVGYERNAERWNETHVFGLGWALGECLNGCLAICEECLLLNPH